MDQKTLTSFRECIPVFQALLDPHRQDIVALLSEKGRLTVKEIVAASPLSRSAISHHLQTLKTVGIVSATKIGTEQFYQLHLTDATKQLKLLVANLEEELELEGE
ncbi:ArsR/SmtB family transcription factor [Enterococcus italicus]|uniref:ArsR/SmtB family transcription factor n=1 Tax=Enterococcus italicus TaxID=246144 RepID=UPI0020736141|nr:metalloregulator ArsR/SmtB family transcription factor [Enterococcus italicus]